MARRLRIRFAGIYRMAADKLTLAVNALAAGYQYVVPSAPWTVGTQTFTQGSGGTSDISTTGPSGKIAGGAYTVDLTGTQLPSGMSLSTSGTLSVGTATAQTVNGVVFEYTDPGALPTLTLHPTSPGTYPYIATVYPLEGVVPAGRVIVSTTDTNLRCSVLSTWPDGSAQVCVLAGSYTFSNTSPVNIGLRVGNASGTDLTTAAVVSAGITVTVNFGGGNQTLVPTTTNHDFVWWANPRVICARYRKACGLGSLEAVIDIHAFADGRAFVEVVIENCKMDSASPSQPANQSYTNATVAVNGTTIATVSSANCPNSAVHQAFRAWYCAAQVTSGTATAVTNGGIFGVNVTHDAASLQAHPMFWKPVRAMTTDYATATYGTNTSWQGVNQTYATDAYSPWATGRHRASNMTGGGEDGRAGIGPLPGWESDYVLTGNRYAANAVIQSALCELTYNVNYRDSTTNLPPHSGQLYGWRSTDTGGTWPAIAYSTGSTNANWETSHQPAGPLVAFLCRPSPCFIELAQKIFGWNHVYRSTDGSYEWFQPRERAWVTRNYGIGVFLTPNNHATFSTWVTQGRALLNRQPQTIFNFRDWAGNKLDALFGFATYDPVDHSSDRPDFSHPLWQCAYATIAWNMVSQMKLLRGADQATFDAATDWLAKWPVRYVNDCANGEWRNQVYSTRFGTLSGSTLTEDANWQVANTVNMLDSFSNAPTGYFINADPETAKPSSYYWANATTATSAALGYETRFWAALCVAKERGISGADTAYATVYGTAENAPLMSNFSTWASGFVDFPIYNRVAR